MPNEIKEILDRLKDDTYVPLEDNREYKLLDKGDDTILLDYITNLQEENKQLRENNFSMQEEMCLRWNELDKLQQRIDKAVEYISNCGCDDEAIDNIEDILRGDE